MRGNMGKKKRALEIVGAGLAGAVVGIGLPLVVGALGLTAVGMAAGSIATSMISSVAIASGRGAAATERQLWPSCKQAWRMLTVTKIR